MSIENLTEGIDQVSEQRKLEVQAFQQKKENVTKLLNGYQSQIAAALPGFLKPQSVIQAVITMMIKKPELMECTGHSIVACVLTASQMGLVFDDFLGEAYMIPFNNNKKGKKEAQFIPGYKGLVSLARRSGQVKSVKVKLVYKKDKFLHEEGLEDKLVHTPQDDKPDEDVTHGYAIIKYLNGGYEFEVMTRKEILEIRDESKNYKFAPNKEKTVWHTSFAAMCKKTVLRQLMKLAPLSPEIARAVSLDIAADMGMQNISVDWLNELTKEEAEDIAHEVMTEEEAMQEEQRQYNQDTAESRGSAATKATEDLLNKKIKNQKINPK